MALGTPANEVQSTLSTAFVRGTDTSIVLASGGGTNFPSTSQVVRLTNGDHWCLLIYSSKSTDTLTMATATSYALAENVSSGDAAYTWPVGSTVELVVAADYLSELLKADGTVGLSADWDAGSFNIRAASLTADGLTSGRMIFTGTDGLFSVDSSLVWNNTNKYLGVGGAPSTSLTVFGNVLAKGAASSDNGQFTIESGSAANTAMFTLKGHNASNDGDYATFSLGTDAPDYHMYVKDVSAGTFHNMFAFDYLNDKIDYKANDLVNLSSIGVGTTTPGGGTTTGTNIVSIKDGTAPAGGVSGQVSLYSASGELYAFDSSGNATLLSPHRFDLFDPDPSYDLPFSYYSENRFIGKKVNVDMYGAIKAIEQLTGKQFIFVEDLPIEETIDWDENEEKQRLQREKEISAWVKGKANYDKAVAEYEVLPADKREKEDPPEEPGEQPVPYVKRTPPRWIAERVQIKDTKEIAK